MIFVMTCLASTNSAAKSDCLRPLRWQIHVAAVQEKRKMRESNKNSSYRGKGGEKQINNDGGRRMKPICKTAWLTALLLPATASVAQMRPGAKVEKTYGLGLPRDMDKLIIDDSEYPDYPLKPGQEAYEDVDGYRIKQLIKKFTAISLQS